MSAPGEAGNERASGKVLWRERIELGVAFVDESGPTWIPVGGQDVNDSMELLASLTEALSADWLAVFCHCGNARRPLSSIEISTELKLDPEEVARCIARLKKEKLLMETTEPGTYLLAKGGRLDIGRERSGACS